jgi:thiol-disulfide isomerase/thioredoxin
MTSQLKAQPAPEVIEFEVLQQRYQQEGDTTYVVNFWATWCRPCVKELPHFEKIQDKYKNQHVKVILVSLDFKSNLEDQVIPFLKENEITTEVVLLPQKGANEWINQVSPDWSGAIPATLFINNQKDIRKFHEKAFTFKELETIVKQILQS